MRLCVCVCVSVYLCVSSVVKNAVNVDCDLICNLLINVVFIVFTGQSNLCQRKCSVLDITFKRTIKFLNEIELN